VHDQQVVSFSADERNTFGGNLRFSFKKEDVPEPKPMCYTGGPGKEWDYTKYTRIRDGEWVEGGSGLGDPLRVHRQTPDRKPDESLDAYSARVGITANLYMDECETMSPGPVPLNKAKSLEFWLGWRPDDYQVSCNRSSPASIDGSGWNGVPWDKQLEAVERAREAAKTLGLPFEVKSCFPFVKMRYGYIPLSDEVLHKLARGEEVEPLAGDPPEEIKSCRC